MKNYILTSSLLLAPLLADHSWARDTATRQPSMFRASGFSGLGSFDTPLSDEEEMQVEQLFEDAGHNPNGTSSATFNFAPFGPSRSSSWVWRVNISDIAVPQEIFNTSGLRVVNNQWELQYRGDSPETSTNDSQPGKPDFRNMCITAIEFTAPADVTSRSSEPGDCSAVLGNECYSKYLAAVTSSSCASPLDLYNSGIKECDDIFSGSVGIVLASTSFGNNSDIISTEPGNVVWHDTSTPEPEASFPKTYAQAETQLNVLILRTNSGSSVAMVCQIVNKAVASSSVRQQFDRNSIIMLLAVGLITALF